MPFGQKSGSLKSLKKTLSKSGNGAFIKYIPKNSSMNVRFIQEPEEWVNYVEHYDPVAKKSFPCNGEAGCPGCRGDERKTSRYLTNAVDLDNGNRVIPLQLPKDLANRLVVKYEKWGTLTDRDIELSRSGEGLDTVYDLDASVPDRKNIAKFTPHDLEKVLEDAYNAVFGPDEEEDDEPVVPRRAAAKRQKSAAAKKATAARDADDDVDVDDEDDEPPAKPAKKAAAKKATKKAAAKKEAPPEPQFEADEDDDEDEEDVPADVDDAEDPADDEPDTDTDDDGDEGWDEESLRALPFGALRKVAREFGVSTKGKDADTIIGDIMDSGDAVDEYGEPPY